MMAKCYRELSDDHMAFIRKQHLFFTATAPSDDGRINLSPKGYDTLRILDATTLLYLDYAGSGNETACHLRDNGKITLMWCSFDEKPLIMRIYGYGRVIGKDCAEFGRLAAEHYPAVDPATVRQLFLIKLELMQTSCGYGVPHMMFVGERTTMQEWSDNKVKTGMLEEYIANNSSRLDEKQPVMTQKRHEPV